LHPDSEKKGGIYEKAHRFEFYKSGWHCESLRSLPEIRKLKATAGSDLQVHGSGELVQHLFRNDLADEFWLKIHPLTHGKGKRLLGTGTIPAAFTLTESSVTPAGVIFANYKRSGEVKTGTVGT
jgi:dihydrofolate reductase